MLGLCSAWDVAGAVLVLVELGAVHLSAVIVCTFILTRDWGLLFAFCFTRSFLVFRVSFLCARKG